jgi:predicted CoA-binding protein
MVMKNEIVAILGASNKPDRYAYKAFKMLQEYGHTVIPINPALDSIESVPAVKSVNDINQKVTTLTIYMRPERYMPFLQDIIKLKPNRVIFNPGTESDEAVAQLQNTGINGVYGCTLVMLRTGQF